MSSNLSRLLLLAVLLLTACVRPANTPTPAPLASSEPFQVQGEFTVTNDFVLSTYYVEHAVGLVDMHGFVLRDREWELPVEGQVLGFMDINDDFLGGSFDLNLPAKPEGELSDVNPDGQSETGVQIFAVAYSPNLYGGPFSVGDDRSRGWPSYLASVITDSENQDEVIGGDLLVWAPDAAQMFPSGFGADGLLFSDDDPVAALPAGWTKVNLDAEPFTLMREPTLTFTLYEPKDVAIKDYSSISYLEAYDAMFAVIRNEYAFNGVEGKEPDWGALNARVRPLVEQAQANRDRKAYYLALNEVMLAFNDAHVGLGGGSDYFSQIFSEQTAGGYGFAARELDDGRFLVVYLLAGSPADQVGIQLGAQLTAVNGEPVADAVARIRPLSMPHSSDFALRYQQVRYLLRAPLGTETAFTFTNPGGVEQTVTLKAISERESFNFTSINRERPANFQYLQPVEYRILDSGIGYVRINSNYDDLGLIVRLFERALQTFQAAEVEGIIIDMRFNSGGAPLGLAGFLTDQEIEMGQLAYYSDATGKFEAEGLRDKVLPNENQYRFDKMVLLVGMSCFSACEEEAYGFSQVPGMIVVGQYPTAGGFGEVARGQFILPDGFSMQFPTGRFTLPDGSIFLEGQGVPPTLRVPIDESTVFQSDDVVLAAGERAVLQPLGAGITPAGPPKLADATRAESQLLSGAKFLEDMARESYEASDLSLMDSTFDYTIPLSRSETLVWGWGWCAKPKETLDQNMSQIQLAFTLNGQDVPLTQMANYQYSTDDGQFCTLYYAVLSEWQGGENHLTTRVTFTQALNDGTADYPTGYQLFEYTVYVKP